MSTARYAFSVMSRLPGRYHCAAVRCQVPGAGDGILDIVHKLVYNSLGYGGTGFMRISAKTEYACIAMFELASQYGSGEPVRIRQIAQRHDVPPRFLVQILLQLKGAGLVASVRGAAGGYQLLCPPDEISFGRVMEAIDGLLDEEGQTAAPRPTLPPPKC